MGSGHKPSRQAQDVALPKVGNIRALDIDTGGFVQDVNAIVESRATSASEDTVTGAGLDGAIGAAAMVPPRNLEFTLSTHADFDAVVAVVTGTDYNGDTLTENFTFVDGGNATVAGVELFATVVSVVIPAQSGTGGAWELGTGMLASLEEYYGRYVTFISSVALHVNAAPTGTTWTTPVSTASEVASDALAAPIPADTYFSGRPKQTAEGTPVSLTGQLKVLGSDTGVLHWWPSDNSDAD